MSIVDLRQSIGLRLVLIFGVSLALAIPVARIMMLIDERKERRDEVVADIGQHWGGEQTIVGPILAIPYREVIRNENHAEMTVTRQAYFLPDELRVNGELRPDVRQRGIYEATVYDSQLTISGQFGPLDWEALDANPSEILWDRARLSLGITDLTGLASAATIEWNGQQLKPTTTIDMARLTRSGVGVPVDLGTDRDQSFAFSSEISLRGTSALKIFPGGGETEVNLASTWSSPSFVGDWLPAKRTVTDSGFTASWTVFDISREMPRQWVSSSGWSELATFGVKLIPLIDPYQKTMRTVKYAILFIGLTFLTFFMIEALTRRPLHPLHYALIGLGLIVFYSLLLSLSEYISFGLAYLISATAIISLIVFYARGILSGARSTLSVTGVLIVLYGYLYTILQLSDYALLLGSLLLFVAVALAMAFTRSIDWFSVFRARIPATESRKGLPPIDRE